MNENVIDKFLKQHDLTRYQVSKVSGLNASTFSEAVKKPLNNLTIKTLRAIAMPTNFTAGEVLDELTKLSGNPLIIFIENHPGLDKNLVSDIENLMIELHEKNVTIKDTTLKDTTFNQYYEDVENGTIKDSNENAEAALRSGYDTILGILKKIEKE